MAKSTSLKPETKPPKRKKLSQITNEKHVDEMMDTTVKKKKKEVEVSSTAYCVCIFLVIGTKWEKVKN